VLGVVVNVPLSGLTQGAEEAVLGLFQVVGEVIGGRGGIAGLDRCENGADVAHVQIADSPGRGEPGSGSLPIDGTLDALTAAGYRGVVACEYKPTTNTTSGLTWLGLLT
jgi:hypothetical protein